MFGRLSEASSLASLSKRKPPSVLRHSFEQLLDGHIAIEKFLMRPVDFARTRSF